MDIMIGQNYFTGPIWRYNPLNNLCGLSLDKTDHVIQNRTPSDLISIVCFYFNGEKTRKQANVQAKLAFN